MKKYRATGPEERPEEAPDPTGSAAPAAGVKRLRDAFDGRIMAIGLVAAFALAVDSAHPAKADLVLQPAWFLALYGALPFCVAVLVEGAGRWRAAVPAACGAFLIAVLIATRACPYSPSCSLQQVIELSKLNLNRPRNSAKTATGG